MLSGPLSLEVVSAILSVVMSPELEGTGMMSLEIESKTSDAALSLQIGDTEVSFELVVDVMSLDIGNTGYLVYHLPNNSGKMLYL